MLLEQWSSDSPPTNEDHPPLLTDALYVMSLPRPQITTAVYKRAFYEVLASETFWNEVRAGEHSTLQVLPQLYAARAALQTAWREHVCTPPQPFMAFNKKMSCSCGSASSAAPSEATRAKWRATFADLIVTEKRDPLRAASQTRDIDRRIEGLVIIGIFVKDSFNICLTCAFEREQAWREVGKKWWKMLDEWVGVTGSGAQPA